MNICMFGSGAVGGTIGSMLANAEHEVTFIARGQHLRNMQDWGLKMITPEGTQTVYGNFTNLFTRVVTPDYLFLCVKAFSIPEIEESVSRLTGPNTIIVPVINGVPWWNFKGKEGKLKDYIPKCLDPHGNLAKYFPYEHMLGSVVYMAATVPEPGVVQNMKHPPKFKIGEISDKRDERLAKLGGILSKAGFKNPIAEDIRAEIWSKLSWNIAFNPLSAITKKNCIQMVEDRDTREMAVMLMRELKTVAEAAEVDFELDIEDRIIVAQRSGEHKPSMLQDLENGRKLETEAIVGAVVDIADKAGVECPKIEDIYKKLKALTL